MIRALLPALLLATLAGCTSAPKKTAPAPAAAAAVMPASGPTVAARPGTCSKAYAPAQEDPGTRGNYRAGGLYAPGVPDTTPDYVPNLDCIAEPEVVALPRSAVGNRSPYAVLGKNYHVLDRVDGHVEQGTASYYGKKFHGRLTSNREVYDMYAFTAAHKSLPLPSFARVTNLDNGRSVVVRVNDRGPFHEGRVIDLSYAAAVKLDITRRGTGRVEVRALLPGDTGSQLAVATPPVPTTIATGIPTRIATGKPTPMDQLVERLPPPQPILLAALQSDAPAVVRQAQQAPAQAQAQAPSEASAQPWRYQVTPELEKTASADEFEAWMQSRGVRVATGRPAATTPSTTTAATSAPAPAAPVSPARSFATSAQPATRGQGIAGSAAALDDSPVQLQVGSFASRENADRALARLSAAGIAQASLSDVARDGRTLWRLRVGASDFASASQLAARIAGLGFGQPQVVRE